MGALRFLADENLASLARWLRMGGFDVAHRNPAPDGWLLETALAEDRVVLTRDRKLVETGRLPPALRGPAARARIHLLEAGEAADQLVEVCRAFGLDPIRNAYRRCTRCNVPFEAVSKESVAGQVPARSFEAYAAFWRCPACSQVFWEGEHVARSRSLLERARRRSIPDGAP